MNLGIRSIAGFANDLFAEVDFDDGRDVGMPAVVAELGVSLRCLARSIVTDYTVVSYAAWQLLSRSGSVVPLVDYRSDRVAVPFESILNLAYAHRGTVKFVGIIFDERHQV